MHTAICIASGPSLTKEDVEFCQGRGKVYAVKECKDLAPWADVLYAADTDWWERLNGVPDFAGERWTVSQEAAKKYGINVIDYKPQDKWSNDSSWIATGGNSGFQAINLAVLQGASRVILLGYDMGHEHGSPKHWWTGKQERPVRTSNYKDWIEHFNKAAPLIPVPVINASRRTALNCFVRMSLQDAFVHGAE